MSDDVVKQLRETAGALINDTMEDGSVSTFMLIDAASEIESLREQLKTAQAAYLQFREGHEAKLAKATAALEAVEDALTVGIVVTFAGIPIDHTKLNHAVEAARSCLREISK